MKYLSKRHKVLLLNDAVLAITNGRRLPRNAVCITFDDGYHDNYTNAYPILRTFRLPATFFLTTGFLGSKKPTWQLALSAYLRLSPRDSLLIEPFDKSLAQLGKAGGKLLGSVDPSFANADGLGLLRRISELVGPDRIEEIAESLMQETGLASIRLPLASPRDRAKARKFLTGLFVGRPQHEIELLLDIVRLRLGLKGVIYVPLGRMMTWDEVKDMVEDGMSFGSHTCTHPILTRLQPTITRQEIVHSKRRLEAVLKKPVKLFCYPNGLNSDFNDDVITEVKKAGFIAACSIVPGTNKHVSDLFALRRIGPDPDLAVFATKLSGIIK